MDLTLILLITFLLIGLQYLFKPLYKFYKHRQRIIAAIEPLGGEKWYPLIGTCLDLIKANRETFYDIYTARNLTHGPFFRTWMGFIPAIHIMKAEHIEPVLSSTVNLAKGDNYRFMMPWLGQGLITNSSHTWRSHRKLVTPAFHFAILDTMTEIFAEKAARLVQLLDKEAGGEYFNIFPYLTRCSLDIICETAMGVEVNAMDFQDSEYVSAVYEMAEIMLYRMFHPYLHPTFLFNLSPTGREHNKCLSILHGFARKVIRDRKKKLEESAGDQHEELTEEDKMLGKKRRMAFLDHLLEANKKNKGLLTDEEIREEVDTFMFAGHDTTNVTVGWALFSLSNYPDIQEKVHQELDDVFHGDDERPITPQDIANMPYLDMVFKETMRFIPTVPVVARNLSEDLEIGGHLIPSGVMVTIHLAHLHKDPEQFPNPFHYDPDRFLPENIARRHPYAFVPFSAGPRNCVGQKFAMRNGKVMLATILRKYKVRAEKTVAEMKFAVEVTLRPQGGILNLALVKRKK